MIEIYPSLLDGEPLERHPIGRRMTIHAWLTANSPGYRCHDVHPFSIGVVPAEVALCGDLTDKQKSAGVKSFAQITQGLKPYMGQYVSSFRARFAEPRLRRLGAT